MRSKKNKHFIYSRNIIFPIILILGGIAFIFNDMGIMKWYHLKQELNKIQITIDQLISKEKVLNEELWQLKNDDQYIKKIARERFHMVRPGEKVFRVVDRRSVNNRH